MNNDMPHKLIIASTGGNILDGSVFAASFGLIGASIAGIEIDTAVAGLAAAGGFMIALGRTAVYLANAYKTYREAQLLGDEE